MSIIRIPLFATVGACGSAVKDDELALIVAWADAFDAAHAGGAHEGHDGHGGHKH